MKENERSANKVRGYLLQMPDSTFVFRVYISADRKEWKDYEIRHNDLEVEIVDNYSSFYEEDCKKGDYTQFDGYISYPSRLTDKKSVTNNDSVVK